MSSQKNDVSQILRNNLRRRRQQMSDRDLTLNRGDKGLISEMGESNDEPKVIEEKASEEMPPKPQEKSI